MATIDNELKRLDGMEGTAYLKDGRVLSGMIRIDTEAPHPVSFEDEDSKLTNVPLTQVKKLTIFEPTMQSEDLIEVTETRYYRRA